LSLIFGAIVGFSLGLTGGGGAIFAVPLLVYGLEVDSREAVGVSLITVGATALVGFVERARGRMVELPTGLLFAISGMMTATLGAWLSRRLPEPVLLVLFGGLMLVIALRMWLASARWTWSTKNRRKAQHGSEPPTLTEPVGSPACRRDALGKLALTSRCALRLTLAGLAAGVLTGLFGVGGGFIIVPALTTFSGMNMQRAIGTSLLVITLVSLSGIAGHFLAVGTVPWTLTGMFLAGSLAGLAAGSCLASRLAGPRLQQVFATAIVLVGVFVIVRNIWS
jgi:uncharacterized membrane protein YfcA